MKKFKVTTLVSLCVTGLLIIGNVFYLYRLYQSLREQTRQTVADCLRRADILEIISRLGSRPEEFGKDKSFISMKLVFQGEPVGEDTYSYSGMARGIETTMNSYFHIVEQSSSLPPRNLAVMDSIFRDELHQAGLYPEAAIVVPSDSVIPERGLWKCSFTPQTADAISYTAYFSSQNGHILREMAGIIITSSGILLVMFFLIGYLLRFIGRLRTIEEMKDDFTHNMTHELKTPVAVAYSAADSMLRYYDGADETRNRKLLTVIMQRLTYLSGMIENILSMSMERFRKINLQPQQISLKPMFEELAEMISLKADKPVNIEIAINPASLTVEADPLHLGNIINNLLDNAVKYSGESVNIRLSADESGIIVSDNGIGISREHLPYVFDKFYRVPTGDRYEVGGYGLGLYYVDRMVDLFGWGISVRSEPGKGTTFTISFCKR